MPSATTQHKLFNTLAFLLIGGKVVQVLARRARHRAPAMPETRPVAGAPARHDAVTQASMESFPASDAPSFSPGFT